MEDLPSVVDVEAVEVPADNDVMKQDTSVQKKLSDDTLTSTQLALIAINNNSLNAIQPGECCP